MRALCPLPKKTQPDHPTKLTQTGKTELQILDYPSQQYRLLPLVAASVAFFFSGRAVLGMLRETEAALASGRTGQVRAFFMWFDTS